MSYQDFLESVRSSSEEPRRSTSSSIPQTSPLATTPGPTQNHVIHRKPPANYSPIPFNSSPGSVHKTVTQFNSLRSASQTNVGLSLTPVTSNSKRNLSGTNGYPPASAVDRSAEPAVATSPQHKLATARAPALAPASVSTSTPATAPIANEINDYPPPPAHAEWHASLKQCLAIQNDAVLHHNKRPFAALLLGPDKSTILLSHFSISHVQHAESELARLASLHYSTEYLRKCTLVSTWEPCAMCAGTIYWSGIGRVVYAASEARLRDLTGPGNNENMTMDLPCRTIFNAGQSKVDVVGPVPGWEDKVVEESRKWWKEHKSQASNGVNGHVPASSTASVKTSSIRSYTVITNPPPEEGVLSRIGEDGEYKADLKIDWMM